MFGLRESNPRCFIPAFGSEIRETGTFNLTANFGSDQGRGSLAGATNTFIVSGDNLSISATNGSISSQNVQMGRILGGSALGETYGNFYGSSGQGVGGVVFSTQDSDVQYLGTYLGQKK